ncbi:MAG: ABC transporter substrate-binding protein [Anaeromyxobacter sp.]
MRCALLAALALALALLLPAPTALAVARPAYGGELRLLLPAVPRAVEPGRAVEPADVLLMRALHATPLELDADGRLVPGLLEEVPAPQVGGRAFRLRLRPGLRFSDGTPLGAQDVAASLARLLRRDVPGAWVALPILGADALLDGRAAALAGVQVLSDRELLVTLAFPLPEWPWALAAPAAAVTSPRGAGAGPFRLVSLDAGGARLAQNPEHHRGRPFADALWLGAADARAAARALERGEVDGVLRPEAASPDAVAGPALTATVVAQNPGRLGAAAEPVRRALLALDRAELARRFVRGPSAPLETVVPPGLLPAPPLPAPAPTAAAAPAQAALLVLATAPDGRAVADRLQVQLSDRGVRLAVQAEPPERYAARLAAGDYDLALVAGPPVALQPSLAAGAVALAVRGPAAARQAMAGLAGLDAGAAQPRAAGLSAALQVVPLHASGLRATAAPALQGWSPRADGTVDPGDLWRLGGGR